VSVNKKHQSDQTYSNKYRDMTKPMGIGVVNSWYA